MKLIVIFLEGDEVWEVFVFMVMLVVGLECYYVCKFNWFWEKLVDWFGKLFECWWLWLVLYQYYEFVDEFKLGGWYWCDDGMVLLELLVVLMVFFYGLDCIGLYGVVSCLCYDLVMLWVLLGCYDLVLLGLVFFLIFKQGYGFNGMFSLNEFYYLLWYCMLI